ncbi:MAG TPA: cardiolipin synthase, partial [Methylophaga sp.]|nr:cardiolipin synthase [Methylophaga sp.]
MNLAIASMMLHILILVIFIVRILTRPHRQPASRIAWIVVIISLPLIGVLAYILFGEVNIGRRRIARLHRVIEQ